MEKLRKIIKIKFQENRIIEKFGKLLFPLIEIIKIQKNTQLKKFKKSELNEEFVPQEKPKIG